MDGTWGSAGISDSDLNDLQRRVSCLVHVSGRRCEGCGSFLRQDNGGKVCAPCSEKEFWAAWKENTRYTLSAVYSKAEITPEVIERFWELCRNGSAKKCWGWRGSTSGAGLPIFRRRFWTYQARRVSFAIHGGGITEGEFVVSQCRNKVCCNPRHLGLALSGKSKPGRGNGKNRLA